ncbi:MAG: hypothetical protein KKE73_15980 [Proteobacteria bacterium]|nr:hypothetical protein [Pseudomonadota bacterium]
MESATTGRESRCSWLTEQRIGGAESFFLRVADDRNHRTIKGDHGRGYPAGLKDIGIGVVSVERITADAPPGRGFWIQTKRVSE